MDNNITICLPDYLDTRLKGLRYPQIRIGRLNSNIINGSVMVTFASLNFGS